jgi:hypothetical protein
LAYFQILETGTVLSSRTSVNFSQATLHHIPEDRPVLKHITIIKSMIIPKISFSGFLSYFQFIHCDAWKFLLLAMCLIDRPKEPTVDNVATHAS